MNARISPVRLQLSRRKGFRLQALSLSINGLPAVKCTRRGKWSNPWRVGEAHCPTVAEAVRMFASRLTGPLALPMPPDSHVGRIAATIGELRGKNLACWCPLCDRHASTGKPLGDPCSDCSPCHTDTLGELANR